MNKRSDVVEISREVHKQAATIGVDVMDVAISGSTPAAEHGTLTLLVGRAMSNGFTRHSPYSMQSRDSISISVLPGRAQR